MHQKDCFFPDDFPLSPPFSCDLLFLLPFSRVGLRRGRCSQYGAGPRNLHSDRSALVGAALDPEAVLGTIYLFQALINVPETDTSGIFSRAGKV